MATDNFTATNNPLASPWQTRTNLGAMLSTGGQAQCVTHDVSSGMTYAGASSTFSQVLIRSWTDAGGRHNCGPALWTSTGNGYRGSCNGSTAVVGKYTAGAFDGENTPALALTQDVDHTFTLYIDGNDVVLNIDDIERVRWTETTYRAGLESGVWSENNTAPASVDDWTDGAAEASNVYVVGTAQRNRRHSGHFM